MQENSPESSLEEYSSQKESFWESLKQFRPWLFPYVVLGTLNDSLMVSTIFHGCRFSGGLLFLGFVFLFQIFTDIPVIHLLCHFGVFTGKGLTAALTAHSRVFRGVGYAFVALVIVRSCMCIYVWIEAVDLMCNGNLLDDTRYNCPEDYRRAKPLFENDDKDWICCVSLVDYMQGVENHCVANISLYNNAPLMHHISEFRNLGFHYGYSTSSREGAILAILTVFFMAAFLYIPFPVEGYLNALAGVLSIVVTCTLFVYGMIHSSILTGIVRMYKLTQLGNFFSRMTLELFIKVTISMSIGKVSLISLASYAEPRCKMYKVSVIANIWRYFIIALLFVFHMGVYGAIESSEGRYFSGYAWDKDYHASKFFISEYLLAFYGNMLGTKLYYALIMILASGNILASVSVLRTIIRDHFSHYGHVGKIGVTIMGMAAHLSYLTLFTVFEQNIGRESNFLAVQTALFLTLIVFALIQVYGEIELLRDLRTRYEIPSGYFKFLSPLSKFNQKLIGSVIPGLMTFILICCMSVRISQSFSKEEEERHTFLVASVIVGIFNSLPSACLIFTSLRDILSNRSRGWLMLGPTEDHPFYKRVTGGYGVREENPYLAKVMI